MKKTGVLNKELSAIVASMGHTDMLLVCDAGFPIPNNACRVDLALCEGIPSLTDTLNVILRELAVEKIIVEQETKDVNPGLFNQVMELFIHTAVDIVPHDQLKRMAENSKAVVRTGECTPYGNLILIGGVVY